jgi:hypothetical protein
VAYVPVSLLSFSQSNPSDFRGELPQRSVELIFSSFGLADGLRFVVSDHINHVLYRVVRVAYWESLKDVVRGSDSLLIVTFANVYADGEEMPFSRRLKVWRLPDGSTRAARFTSPVPESEEALAYDQRIARLREMVAKLNFCPLD